MGDLVAEGKASKYYTHDCYGEVDGWEWINESSESIFVCFGQDPNTTYELKPGQSTEDIF